MYILFHDRAGGHAGMTVVRAGPSRVGLIDWLRLSHQCIARWNTPKPSPAGASRKTALWPTAKEPELPVSGC